MGAVAYDIVNVGREALATLSNSLFEAMNKSTTAKQVLERGQDLLALQADANSLLCSDQSFSFGEWITMARRWGNTTEEMDFLETVARMQPTTWLPACDPTTNPRPTGCGSTSGLMDYANKQWGGLVGAFYSERLKCYIGQAEEDFSNGQNVNTTAYYEKLDMQSWQFQHDIGGRQFPLCWTPVGDPIYLSRLLIEKYWPIVQDKQK